MLYRNHCIWFEIIITHGIFALLIGFSYFNAIFYCNSHEASDTKCFRHRLAHGLFRTVENGQSGVTYTPRIPKIKYQRISSNQCTMQIFFCCVCNVQQCKDFKPIPTPLSLYKMQVHRSSTEKRPSGSGKHDQRGNANPHNIPTPLSLYKMQVHRSSTEKATRVREAWPKRQCKPTQYTHPPKSL